MIAIFGSSGHAKVIADILLSQGNKNFIFVDKKSGSIKFNELTIDVVEEDKAQFDQFILGMGFSHNKVRHKLLSTVKKVLFPALIHPKAIISQTAKIEAGTVVMAGAIINTHTVIRENCVINTGAIIEHDCKIGQNTFINPGAVLAGTVTIGENCVIGMNASIRDGITITNNVFVGAGAYVHQNITEPGTYMGTPAKRTGDYKL